MNNIHSTPINRTLGQTDHTIHSLFHYYCYYFQLFWNDYLSILLGEKKIFGIHSFEFWKSNRNFRRSLENYRFHCVKIISVNFLAKYLMFLTKNLVKCKIAFGCNFVTWNFFIDGNKFVKLFNGFNCQTNMDYVDHLYLY